MKYASVLLLAIALIPSARAADVFVGVYESETRKNFGSDTPGEYRLEIIKQADGKYLATFFHSGEELAKQSLIPCPVEKEDYLNKRAPGPAAVLCTDRDLNLTHGVIAYAENGISVPAIKERYSKNPDLVKQDGLEPGDPALFEVRRYTTKYYAHVRWYFYGFRKVS